MAPTAQHDVLDNIAIRRMLMGAGTQIRNPGPWRDKGAHLSGGSNARQPVRRRHGARNEPLLPVKGSPKAHDGPLLQRVCRLQRLAARSDADRAYRGACRPQVRQPARQLLPIMRQRSVLVAATSACHCVDAVNVIQHL